MRSYGVRKFGAENSFICFLRYTFNTAPLAPFLELLQSCHTCYIRLSAQPLEGLIIHTCHFCYRSQVTKAGFVHLVSTRPKWDGDSCYSPQELPSHFGRKAAFVVQQNGCGCCLPLTSLRRSKNFYRKVVDWPTRTISNLLLAGKPRG